MGLFDKLKNVFKNDKKKQEEVKNYDEGLQKTRREYPNKITRYK